MLAIGTTVAGYRIDGVLGRGGMGVVYEATQLSLNRKVALKLIVPELGQDGSHQERFRREGLRQAAIDHPNIVTVHEAGEAPEGLFFAMRLVRGPNLKDMILGRELDAGRALRILTAVADALDTAHEAGMIHRDIKPQNVLIGGRDHAYLADFGLTKTLGDHTLTRSGQFVGTLDYVAPEQIRGETASPSSDIYSLTAVLFESLTGVVPYPRESEAAVLYGHLSLPPPKASEQRPDLPPTLDRVIARGMAKDPGDRFADGHSLMKVAMECFSRKSRAAMTPPGPLESPEEAGVRMGEAKVSTAESAMPRQDTPVEAFHREPPLRAPASEPERSSLPLRRSDPEATTPVVPARGTRKRPRLIAALVVAGVLAVAGYLAGSSGGELDQPEGREVATGPLRLEVPRSWRRTPATPNVPGLELTRAASFAPSGSGAGTTLVAGMSDGEGPTLLPPSFLKRLPRPPATDDRVQLGDLGAIRYRDLRPRGLGGRLTMFVVPTAKAVATVACLRPNSGGSAMACEQAAASLRLPGQRALSLGGRAAYAEVLNNALRRLGRRRAQGREKLRVAKEPSGQVQAARGLADAYGEAGAALRKAPDGPAERPAQASLVGGAGQISDAYSRLARAAEAGDRGAYERAADSVRNGERAFERALAAYRRVGYTIR